MKETYLHEECEKVQSRLLKYLPTWITKQSDTKIAEINKLN